MFFCKNFKPLNDNVAPIYLEDHDLNTQKSTRESFYIRLNFIGPMVLRRRFLGNVNNFSIFFNYRIFNQIMALRLKELEFPLYMVNCFKFDWNWPSGSGKKEFTTTTAIIPTTTTGNGLIKIRNVHLILRFRWAKIIKCLDKLAKLWPYCWICMSRVIFKPMIVLHFSPGKIMKIKKTQIDRQIIYFSDELYLKYQILFYIKLYSQNRLLSITITN